MKEQLETMLDKLEELSDDELDEVVYLCIELKRAAMAEANRRE